MERNVEDSARVQALLDSCLIRGHFVLSSGLHSPFYNETARLTQFPQHCEEIVSALIGLTSDLEYDVIVSPALGGLILGYEFARQSGKRFVYCERDRGGKLVIRRAQGLNESERIMVVDNVYTTGLTLSEIIKCVSEYRGICIAAAYIVNRNNKQHVSNTLPILSLASKELPAFRADDCPLCAAHIPLETKGSRPRRSGKGD
jgi:orotate phosphoribosyltransferase